MSEFKDKIIKEVEIIDKAISDDEERKVVMKSIEKMIQDFATHLVRMADHQNEIDKQIAEIKEEILDIQGQITDDYEMPDQKCPYCGDLIPSWMIEEDKYEIECPNCHKIVEVDFFDDET